MQDGTRSRIGSTDRETEQLSVSDVDLAAM